MKITTNIHRTLLKTLTCMQVLRNIQRQNNATIHEEKDRFALVGFTGDFWHKIENSKKTKITNSKEKDICFFQKYIFSIKVRIF